jgi:hypothetical protein
MLVTRGYFLFLIKIMHSQSSFNSKNMLNDTSILKSKLFNLIGGVNFDLYPNFLSHVALPIVFLVLTPIKKMVRLSANIVI